jgi:predicted ABC-type ATPase
LRWFWIIAGINGAGKTTLTQHPGIQSVLGDLPVLNPDTITEYMLALNPFRFLAPAETRNFANILAAYYVEASARAYLTFGQSFIVETVLSSNKYRRYLADAKSNDFMIGMIYVGLSQPELAILRVQDRVKAGGHAVPEDKIRSRWNRSLDNLQWFGARVHKLLVFSNDDPSGEPILVADGVEGNVRIFAPDALPDLTQRLRAINPQDFFDD